MPRPLVIGAVLAALAIALSPDAAARAQGAAAPAAAAAPVDLNAASPAAIRALPVPPAVADAILDHRTYVAWFTSALDLLEVPGVTPELYARLKPLVFVTPVFESTRLEQEDEDRRTGELNALVQRLLSEEGASEGLVDEYVDQIRDPRDVNTLDYDELVSYQNVSPVDAVAVLRERRLSGRIENARQLRAAQGISYWGFRNLRDYVTFEPPSGLARPRLDLQTRVYDTPYLLDDADILYENILGNTQGLTPAQAANFRSVDLNTYAGRLGLDTTDPSLTNKARLRWGPHVRAALLTHRNLGEVSWGETSKGFVSFEDLGPWRTRFGPLEVKRAVLGNYSVAFGLGLLMDNTDFFVARRTGLGYSVRPTGLRGDLSRSDEYALRGAALEAGLGPMRATLFWSRANKDAVLNPDGSFNSYLRMVPRVSNAVLASIREDIVSGVFSGKGDETAFLPMASVMDERVTGAHLGWEFAPGTAAGVTGLEITTRNRVFDGPLADRWDPRPATLVIDPARLEDRDSEIAAGYDSRAIGSWRRLWGADARTVWRNAAFAAEYGKLETSTAPGAAERMFSVGPEAVVGQAYVQYENLTALALWRDYDIGFDDPYGRGFSEDSRFEQTILDGNAYRLRNPYWAMLSRGTPQPKAERGLYLTTRWQVVRELLLSGLEYDTWTRKADDADLSRFTVRLEGRPIFPLRVRLRHAISSRHADRPDDVRAYRSWDSRIELLANLSSYDQLRFLYSTGNVAFAARGRLSGPASGGDTQGDTTAVRGSPSHALQAAVTHQFNRDLAVTFSSEIYDGFLYNYEDNEFVVVDGSGFRNWVLLRSRLSPHLSWRLKWTTDHALARTYVDIRDYGNLIPPTPDGTNARGDRSTFRLQLDASF